MATAIIAAIVFLIGFFWLLDDRVDGLPGCLVVLLMLGIVVGLALLFAFSPFFGFRVRRVVK